MNAAPTGPFPVLEEDGNSGSGLDEVSDRFCNCSSILKIYTVLVEFTSYLTLCDETLEEPLSFVRLSFDFMGRKFRGAASAR